LSITVPPSFSCYKLHYLIFPLKAVQYSTLHHFRPVDFLAELADGRAGCGEVARGGCVFTRNFSVTRSAVLKRRKDTRPNTALVSRSYPAVCS